MKNMPVVPVKWTQLAINGVAIGLLLHAVGGVAQTLPADRNLLVSQVRPAQGQASVQRVALVIGNAGYKDAPLTNPVNDARAIAQALRDSGFVVIARENIDQRSMLSAMREFGDRLQAGGGVGVFYYAGHGMQIKGRNYLIPVGANIEREDEVAFGAVDAQAVLDKMEAAGNGVNIMILDACRNNPFVRGMRSGSAGLAQMDAPVGTLVAFATSPGATASDGGGQNGLYTQHLLTAMQQDGAKVEDVFKQVRANVRRDSQGKQVPWEATSLEGDFFFHPPKAVVAPPMPDASASVEAALWDAVKSSTMAVEVRAYLGRYPNGRFAGEARARLAQLEGGKTPPAAPAATAPVVAVAPARPVQQVTPAPAAAPVATLPARPAPAKAAPSRNQFGFTVGDRWRYQVVDKYKGEVVENRAYRVTKILDGGDVLFNANERLSPDGNLRSYSNAQFVSREFSDHLHSLPREFRVGYTEDFKFRDTAHRSDGVEFVQEWTGTHVVKAKEQVKVPAGDFEAFRIERTSRLTGVQTNGPGRWFAYSKITTWYVPALRAFVARDEEHRVGNGVPDRSRTELTSFELLGPALAQR